MILSGMGSDGTLGLQAVKAVGGLTLAQSPETAQFDSMPRSAINAGCVDIQDSAESLPARILDYLSRINNYRPPDSGDDCSTPDRDVLDDITRLLQKQTRHDFSLYRASTLQRRIERRQVIHDLPSMAEYAEFLRRQSARGRFTVS